jgi:pimeloyl-ACP methyl ester carboxylesterase
MPTAELDELSLHYEEHGSGDVLLLISGIPGIADDWRPFVPRLTGAGHRVIAHDNRGSGQSTVTPGPYSTAQMAADALALLDRLEVERADVFGVSMGGMIAQELALAAPARVRRLVLGCTHAGVAHAVRPPRETGRAFAMQTDDWALRMRTLAPLAFAVGRDPAMVDAFVAKKSGDVQAPAGYQAQIDAVLAHDTATRLGAIAAPTLIITGDDDRVIPAESSRLLAERIPHAQLHVIAGAGHLFFLEQPEATAGVLIPFLAAETPPVTAARAIDTPPR